MIGNVFGVTFRMPDSQIHQCFVRETAGGRGIIVGEGELVGVEVSVRVKVAVAVEVKVGVKVRVRVGVDVEVRVQVAVGVREGVAVLVDG